MRGVPLDRLDEIRDEVVPTLHLHFYIRPALLHPISKRDKTVVRDTEPTRDDRDNSQDNISGIHICDYIIMSTLLYCDGRLRRRGCTRGRCAIQHKFGGRRKRERRRRTRRPRRHQEFARREELAARRVDARPNEARLSSLRDSGRICDKRGDRLRWCRCRPRWCDRWYHRRNRRVRISWLRHA